jgi:hypothetical protein
MWWVACGAHFICALSSRIMASGEIITRSWSRVCSRSVLEPPKQTNCTLSPLHAAINETLDIRATCLSCTQARSCNLIICNVNILPHSVHYCTPAEMGLALNGEEIIRMKLCLLWKWLLSIFWKQTEKTRFSNSRMVSSGLLRRVALVRTDVSEEPGASFIRVTEIGALGTTQAATRNRRTLRRNTKIVIVIVIVGFHKSYGYTFQNLAFINICKCASFAIRDFILLPRTAGKIVPNFFLTTTA